MEQHTKGSGEIRTFRGTPPTENVDGTPYVHRAEDFFRYYLTNDRSLIPANFDPVTQAELKKQFPPDDVELVNGEFTQPMSIDATPEGLWYVTFSTVNVVLVGDPDYANAANSPYAVKRANGDVELEGPVYPAPLELEIFAAPLAPPLYPSSIS